LWYLDFVGHDSFLCSLISGCSVKSAFAFCLPLFGVVGAELRLAVTKFPQIIVYDRVAIKVFNLVSLF